jgi:N-methylhydantoinase B
MPGIAGGKDGTANRLTLRHGSSRAYVVERLAQAVPHEPGEGFEYLYGGGGGWGDPLERDPQSVLSDVLDEYVSVESARRDYGVELTGSADRGDLAVDEGGTERLRRELRGKR